MRRGSGGYVGTRNSGRIAGLLETEIEAGRMTLGQAEWQAQIAFNLDADEVDDVIDRLRRNYADGAPTSI